MSGGRLAAARERRIMARYKLYEDPAGCGQEDGGGGADDAPADHPDAEAALLQEG
jgi:hypothetical protein